MARPPMMTKDDGPGMPPSLEMFGKSGGAKKRPKPMAGGDTPEDEAAEGEPAVTKDMLSYHGSDTTCSTCQHFTDPDQCARPGFSPVEPGGWCAGHESGGGDDEEMGDEGGEMSAEEGYGG